ncbi:hypothetical protein [Methylomonas koyamae]|uniref:hypothetical protein n=1 Tax=Methylomonas koyamae TaxID=702114 RepID=UPI0006D02B2A|nr:hypothetical protein [Methylomonas koyamae]
MKQLKQLSQAGLEFTEAISALRECVANGKPKPETNPSFLSTREIVIIEGIFQYRDTWEAASKQHVEDLAGVLTRDKESALLAPVDVFWAGEGWVCIDGHHRIEAYNKAGMPDSVQVKVFEGTLQQALDKALESNSDYKLPFTQWDRKKAAWRLNLLNHYKVNRYTKKDIVKKTGISDGTTGNMRKTISEFEEKFPGMPMPGTWDEAKRRLRLPAPKCVMMTIGEIRKQRKLPISWSLPSVGPSQGRMSK